MKKVVAEKSFLDKLLDLPGVIIKGYEKIETVGCVFKIESAAKEAVCPRCGKRSQIVHQNHWHLVRDLPICGIETYLKSNRRQWKCQQCQRPFSEELEWVKSRRSYTKRLANNILKQLQKNSIKNVSEVNNISEEEIERMLDDVQKDLKNREIKNVEKLGIDEISFAKGKHNYCGVLVDLETREPLRILKKRTQETLREELITWDEEVLKNIKEVSIDLWRPYQTVVNELMPNAEVVADRFHVMTQVNDELDQERKKQRREVNKITNDTEKEVKLKAITNSKYVLLKNEMDLTPDEQEKLQEVYQNFPLLKQMHSQKENLRKIYETAKNWQKGLFKISDWLKRASRIFPESSKTIRNWIGEIISYFDNHTTNGVVEGINNKLKLIKRIGYGFRNFDNFCTRVFLDWHFQC